ncbi:MAG: hypothetical protein HS129_05395 [Leptospiraceae bacterium]|nr:hypothetical protein [Leptospiraceae bacterium]
MNKNMLLFSTIFLNCENFRVNSLPEKTVEDTLEVRGIAWGENASVEINSVNVKIEQKRFSYTFPLKLW